MKNIRRFTLVELLAVIALIAILSTLGFGVYSYAKGKARESATEALLKQIDAGLEALHLNSHYPPSDDKKFSAIRIEFEDDGTLKSINFGGETLTRVASPNSKSDRMKNARLEAFAKAVDMEVIKNNRDGDYYITDAWGSRIYYRSPGEFKKGSYDLVSAGADGAFGKNNADKPAGNDLTIFREVAGEHVCDDIFTF